MLKTLIIIGVVAIMTSIGEAKTPEEEVLEVAREIIDASNRGDRAKLEELQDFHSRFGANGGLLYMPRDFSEAQPEEQGDKGEEEANQNRSWNFSHWKHPEIYVNGNVAFLTGYLDGFIEVDGERTDFSWRDTCIFEKRDGKWVRIHHHTSTFTPRNN